MRMPRPIPCPTCGVEAWKLEAEIERLRADVATLSSALNGIANRPDFADVILDVTRRRALGGKK